MNLKGEIFKMVVYLSIPLLTYYGVNSPKLNLFGQREIIRRQEIKRTQAQEQAAEGSTSNFSSNWKDFQKWKEQKQL